MKENAHKEAIFRPNKQAEEFFLKAFRERRLAHSWLISGPEGIGKTAMALRFSRFLLQYPLYEPQSLDDVGLSGITNRISSLSHPDITIINAFQNEESRKQPTIGVEEIRKAISFLRLTPGESSYRVVIIDGADHMTSSASNALLKVLEEPPKNSIIFLIACSYSRLLATIRSRCILLKLLPPTYEEFSAALAKIHKDKVTQHNMMKLYELSDGNIRLASLISSIDSSHNIDFFNNMVSAIDSRCPKRVIQWIDSVKPNHENWVFITHFMLKHAAELVKSAANSHDIDLEQKLNYYFKLQERLAQVEALHLDRQNLILSTIE